MSNEDYWNLEEQVQTLETQLAGARLREQLEGLEKQRDEYAQLADEYRQRADEHREIADGLRQQCVREHGRADALQEQYEEVKRERDGLTGRNQFLSTEVLRLDILVRESQEQLEAARDDAEAYHQLYGDQTVAREELQEQLETFRELAQDAADITAIGHGFELDVPVNLGSFKWVEAATHILDTMASLTSNPAKERP